MSVLPIRRNERAHPRVINLAAVPSGGVSCAHCGRTVAVVYRRRSERLTRPYCSPACAKATR